MNIILILIFVVVLALSFVEDYLRANTKFWILCALGVLMVLLAAFKDPVTTADGDVYEKLFVNNEDPLVVLSTEPTFIYLSRIIQWLGGGLFFIFLSYALVSVPIRLKVMNEITPYIFTALLVYIPVYYEVQDLVQIRSAAASAMVMLALKPIVERRYLLASIFVILAILLHYSCVLFLPFIFLGNVRLGKVVRIILAMLVPIGFVMYLLKLDLFSLIPSFMMVGKLEYYVDAAKLGVQTDFITPYKNVFFMVKCVLLCLMLLYYDFVKEKSRYTTLFILMLAVGIFINLTMATVPVIAVRVFDLYGGIADAALFSYLLYLIHPKYVARIGIACVGLYMLVYNMLAGWYFF